MANRSRGSLCLCLVTAFFGTGIFAQDDATAGREVPSFGGPDFVENQLEDDRAVTGAVVDEVVVQPWLDWKKDVKNRTGIDFSIDYTAVALSATESFNDDGAASGMVRFFGSWDLAGKGDEYTGALIWKIENRHKYTDVAPNGFALSELGYVGLVSPPFSDEGTRLTNLFWRQRWAGGRVSMNAGFLDVTDFLDVYMMASPWTGFMNFAFSTGSATIALPNDSALGVAVGAMVTDKMYLIGHVTDTNSDPTQPFDGFDTLINDTELFTSLELGFMTSPARVYFDNVHLTLWHKDKQEQASVADGWGAAFSASRYINDQWMPFIRGGIADEGGTLLESSLSVGLGYQRVPNRDLFGVALNWGKPNEKTFAPGLDNQVTAEAFYRLQFTQQFALTGDIQWLKDPALNPTESTIWMFNLRARVNF